MAKRKQPIKRARGTRATSKRGTRASAANEPTPVSEVSPHDQISFSALSLHQLFEQQTRQMLDRTDLDEEQKQHILVAMNCPCCGAGGMSYTAKLKR